MEGGLKLQSNGEPAWCRALLSDPHDGEYHIPLGMCGHAFAELLVDQREDFPLE